MALFRLDSSSGQFVLVNEVTGSDVSSTIGSRFGISVSLAGGVAVVGCPRCDMPTGDQGRVFVFEVRQTESMWLCVCVGVWMCVVVWGFCVCVVCVCLSAFLSAFLSCSDDHRLLVFRRRHPNGQANETTGLSLQHAVENPFPGPDDHFGSTVRFGR